MTEIPVAQLADLRRRVLRGETVTAEEYRVVLDSIRKSRKAETASKPAKEKKTAVAARDLLDRLHKS